MTIYLVELRKRKYHNVRKNKILNTFYYKVFTEKGTFVVGNTQVHILLKIFQQSGGNAIPLWKFLGSYFRYATVKKLEQKGLISFETCGKLGGKCIKLTEDGLDFLKKTGLI